MKRSPKVECLFAIHNAARDDQNVFAQKFCNDSRGLSAYECGKCGRSTTRHDAQTLPYITSKS